MAKSDGLICAFRVDPETGAMPLGWNEIASSNRRPGWTWIHLDRRGQQARSWVQNKAGLDRHIISALLSEESRPRCDLTGKGTLLILRGVNLNPQSDPEDMVSARLWIENDRIISTRGRKILAIQDLRDALGRGEGPGSIGDFIIDLSNGLIVRMGRVVAELDESVDELEEASQLKLASEARSQLLHLRRRAILLRRYVAPQREALTQLAVAKTNILDDFQRGSLREVSDRVSRLIEELDALRERAAVIQDEVSTRLAEQMNTAMHRLSIVATVFLPLSLFTGLLGINVGGIPGTESPWAFWIVCGLLAVMTIVTIWIFKRLGPR